MKKFEIQKMEMCESIYTETVYIGTGREILSLYKGLMKRTNRISPRYEDNNGLPFVDTKGIQGIILYLDLEGTIYWHPRIRIMGKNEVSYFLLERCE